jgi:hypothetical protein
VPAVEHFTLARGTGAAGDARGADAGSELSGDLFEALE